MTKRPSHIRCFCAHHVCATRQQTADGMVAVSFNWNLPPVGGYRKTADEIQDAHVREITIKQVETESEFQGALDVRERVFVKEQQIPAEEELDEADGSAIHVVAVNRGKTVGTGRLVLADDGWARIGRMAVDKEFRRQGTGGRILDCLENAAREQGSRWSVLHAQEYVKGFYTRRGYREHGKTFLEVDIPHIEMRKRLQP